MTAGDTKSVPNAINKLSLCSNRQHLSFDDCLEVRRENNQNCFVLCCIRQLCTMIRTHTCEQFLNLRVGLGIDFVFVYLFRLIILCDCFVYCCVGCSCCVGFHFLSTKPRDCQGRTSPKRLILCLVGRKTLTQSINQANKN